MEELNVVDEKNKIVDTKTRSEIHKNKLSHRSVMFLVKNEENDILVTKRSHDKEFFPGYWSLVLGGHVKAGDTYELSLKREMKEEIGIIGYYNELGSFKKDIDEETEFVMLYEVIVKEDEVELFKKEFEEGEFWNENKIMKEIKRKDFLPETEQILQFL